MKRLRTLRVSQHLRPKLSHRLRHWMDRSSQHHAQHTVLQIWKRRWNIPLDGKCLDLEGHIKRQNLRIKGLKDRTEHGQIPREFAAGLLKKKSSGVAIETKYRPCHRSLRKRPGDDESPTAPDPKDSPLITSSVRSPAEEIWLSNGHGFRCSDTSSPE